MDSSFENEKNIVSMTFQTESNSFQCVFIFYIYQTTKNYLSPKICKFSMKRAASGDKEIRKAIARLLKIQGIKLYFPSHFFFILNRSVENQNSFFQKYSC